MRILLASSFLFLLHLSYAAPSDTAFSGKHFSRQQLDEDVDYLTGVINRVHPDMYHNTGKTRYQLLIDSVKSQLRDSMSEMDAWPALARLVSALDEGHSTFDFPRSVYDVLKGGQPVLFPLLISGFANGQFVVKADVSDENKLLPGDRITAINGILIPKLVDRLSGYAGGLQSFRAIDVYRNISVCLFLYHTTGPYDIAYVRGGRKYHTILQAISYPALRTNRAARTTGPQPTPGPDYSFSYIGQSCAYLSINTLTSEPEVFGQFLDSCFKALHARPAAKLIIDLRKNGGGNSVLGEMLLGYITNKPFRMAGGEQWKVSREYKDQLSKNLKGDDLQKMAYYLNAVNGSIINGDTGQPKAPPVNPLLYKGKVFVLIGPNTFSSANMLANAIQDYHLATLVGEPSGEPANDYGELIFLTLPNTGFSFATCTKQFIRANGDAKDCQPVNPRYYVSDNPLTRADEVIEFVMKQ